jgi:hypothetical protein
MDLPLARSLQGNERCWRLDTPPGLDRGERVTGIELALSAWELFELIWVSAWFAAGIVVVSGLGRPLYACCNGTRMARYRDARG